MLLSFVVLYAQNGTSASGDLPVRVSTTQGVTASDVCSSHSIQDIPQGTIPVNFTRSSRGVLWNNGPLVSHPGQGYGGLDASAINDPYSTLYGSNVNNNLEYAMADDYVLATASEVQTFDFYSYQTLATGGSTTSTITGCYVQIWDKSPAMGGSVIWGDMTTNRMATSAFCNIYRVTGTALTNNLRPIMKVTANVGQTLPAGHYYVQWAFTGSAASGPWAPPATFWGQPENGNALQKTTSGWQYSDAVGGHHDMAFLVNGNVTVSGNVADVPTNVTATPNGSKCDLSWTNPTTTLDGASLSSITKMVIKRDGIIIKEFTDATVGAPMTYQDNTITSSGYYTYYLYAVNADGDGALACKVVPVALCNFTFNMNDAYGDGWNSASIQVIANDYFYGSASLSNGTSGTATVAAPQGSIQFKWIAGEYDDECTFTIHNANNQLIYTSSGTPTAGVFFTYTNDCGVNFTTPCDPATDLNITYAADCSKANLTWNAPAKAELTYKVYRGATLLATIGGTSYTDEGFDINLGHTWKVVVVCEDGGESDAITASLPACYTPPPPPCDKVIGEEAEVSCIEAKITWTAVIAAKEYKIIGDAGEATVTVPEYTETGIFAHGETYTWKIITICEENESDPVEVSVEAVCEGIHEFGKTISIYPNPANSTVNITAENFAKVEVYSAIGQLVATQNTPTIDVSNYQAGIYFFKVFDNNSNTAMKRISVIK